MNYTVDKKNSEPKVTRLANSVEYEAGSIASKTIIDRKTVSIAVFAFDKFQEIVQHVLPYDTFLYILEGEAEVKIESKASVVKEGETITVPANRPHAISARSRFKALLITLKE